MRILIVNSEYPPVGGGAGNASANVAREFVAMGQEVAVLTSRFKDIPVNEKVDGIRIYRCISFRGEASQSNPWEQLSFLVGSCTDGLNFVRKWRPDVLITFFGVPSGPLGFLSKKILDIPYIVSLRGGDVPGFRPYDFSMYHKLISPLLRVVWREAGHVVANSEGLRELAKEFYPQISVSVISNGVDVGEFKPEDRYWDPPHLLFVGRIVYQKGLDLLMKALLNLKDLPWKMTLVGDGPQLEILRSQAEQVGLLNRINFTGWVERDNLIELYQRANLFVFPSRHEGMPNAVLEAMACGLPVVASRIAGNKDLIIDGETGFLFAANDTKKLCIKLKRLLVDQDLRKVMGTAARDRASNVYSWRNTTQQYFKLIQGIKTD